jgi:hypothetical protein
MLSRSMKLVLFAILIAFCQLPGQLANAQTASLQAVAPLAPPTLILVTITRWGNQLNTPFLTAKFDTGGQGFANMSEADLNKKYAKIPMPSSPASIINFVVQSGYRVVSFSTTQGGAGLDASRYSATNGYVFLCEQVR